MAAISWWLTCVVRVRVQQRPRLLGRAHPQRGALPPRAPQNPERAVRQADADEQPEQNHFAVLHRARGVGADLKHIHEPEAAAHSALVARAGILAHFGAVVDAAVGPVRTIVAGTLGRMQPSCQQ